MNERIRELAVQAGAEPIGGYVRHNNGNRMYSETAYVDHRDVDLEKFVELIVKETITEMCQQLYWHGEDQSNNPAFYKAIDKTKKHFGVE